MTAVPSSRDSVTAQTQQFQRPTLVDVSAPGGTGFGEPAAVRFAAALAALRAGRPIFVADNADRENEVDVILDASHATPSWIAWTIRRSSGYLCAPMSAARADALELPIMVADNEDPLRTAYTVSVDAAVGVTTGISAADRCHTLNVLADPASIPASLIRPGHVLPLRAKPGGVLERPGHTEAAVDLVALSHGLVRQGARGEPGGGLSAAELTAAELSEVRVTHMNSAVACIGELIRDDGEMMRLEESLALAAEFDLVMITIEELRAHLSKAGTEVQALVSGAADGHLTSPVDGPSRTARPATRTGSARLPTRHGEFRIISFRDLDGVDHVALCHGLPTERPVVRVHSECLTGEAFGSLRCDCGPQLDAALEIVAREGGAVIYLRGHEGRGIGIAAKIDAYALQDGGRDTVDANLDLGFPVDSRDYSVAAAILRELELTEVRLLSNNPDKEIALRDNGIEILETIQLAVGFTEENEAYLHAKAFKLGHHIPEAE